MRAYTRRRLLAAAKLGVATVPFMVGLRLAHGEELVPGTFVLGFAFGFIIGVAELFWLRRSMRRLGFLPHLLAKSLIIVALMYVAFLVLNVLDVLIEGISWRAYWAAVTDPELTIRLLEALGVVAFLLFFVQLDRLLGPGVLLGYVTGRYHRPRRESRIFMFLDLKSSTTLAEGLAPERYYAFLHRYFSEMSEPILATHAEIYQYVGDEVVLTWTMRSGLEENSCLRLFFMVREQLLERASWFLSEFGVRPEFKAGVHAGEVISAQIGELKTEIVFNGDVLNTCARIQALCNELGRDLLVSEALLDSMSLGPEYRVERLGVVQVRGKEEGIALCSVSRTSPG